MAQSPIDDAEMWDALVAADGMASPMLMAAALGISMSTLARFHRLGLVKKRDGRYPFLATLRLLYQHKAAEAGQLKSASGDDVVAANIRLRDARARLLELEIAEKEGTLIPLEVAIDVGSEQAANNRDLIMSIPVDARAHGIGPFAKLDALCREKLHDLADRYGAERPDGPGLSDSPTLPDPRTEAVVTDPEDGWTYKESDWRAWQDAKESDPKAPHPERYYGKVDGGGYRLTPEGECKLEALAIERGYAPTPEDEFFFPAPKPKGKQR